MVCSTTSHKQGTQWLNRLERQDLQSIRLYQTLSLRACSHSRPRSRHVHVQPVSTHGRGMDGDKNDIWGSSDGKAKPSEQKEGGARHTTKAHSCHSVNPRHDRCSTMKAQNTLGWFEKQHTDKKRLLTGAIDANPATHIE